MDREKYLELYNSNPSEIELSDSDIKSWLDDITDLYKRLQESKYSLYYGVLNEDEGEYENAIELISRDNPSLHIYKGIDKLVKVIGEKLYLEVEDSQEVDYPYTYSFMHKGVKVFQITKTPLEGVEVIKE